MEWGNLWPCMSSALFTFGNIILFKLNFIGIFTLVVNDGNLYASAGDILKTVQSMGFELEYSMLARVVGQECP